MTTEVASEHVTDVIELFRALYDGTGVEQHHPVVVAMVVQRGAGRGVTLRGLATSAAVGFGLVAVAAMIADEAMEFGMMPTGTGFARPAFALFAAVALAGRFGGRRAAWLGVLAAIPIMALLAGPDFQEPAMIHHAVWLGSLAIVAGCCGHRLPPPRRSWHLVQQASKRAVGWSFRRSGLGSLSAAQPTG